MSAPPNIAEASSTAGDEADSGQARQPNRHARLVQIQRALADGGFDAALVLADELLAMPNGLRILGPVFAKAHKLDALVDLVWARRQSTFNHLSTVADFMRICADTSKGDAFLDDVVEWLLDDGTPALRFSHTNYVSRFKADRTQDLFRIKYKGWDSPEPQNLAQRVEALAIRCETPRPLLETIREQTDAYAGSFAEWSRQVAIAQSFGHVFRDATVAGLAVRGKSEEDFPFFRAFTTSVNEGIPTLIESEREEAFFKDIDTSRGLLITTFHNPCVKLALARFRAFITNNYAVHIPDVDGDDSAPLGSRGRGAAFRAVKALMEGQVVLLAADGSRRSDAAAVEITVRGFPVSISSGAALIAYEASSNTGWYHVDWRDGSFALVFKPGPARKQKESFAHFRDRWLAFYTAQYEAALSANPAYLISFLRDKKQ